MCEWCLFPRGCFSLNVREGGDRQSLVSLPVASSPSLAAVHLCVEEAGVFTALFAVADDFCFSG